MSQVRPPCEKTSGESYFFGSWLQVQSLRAPAGAVQILDPKPSSSPASARSAVTSWLVSSARPFFSEAPDFRRFELLLLLLLLLPLLPEPSAFLLESLLLELRLSSLSLPDLRTCRRALVSEDVRSLCRRRRRCCLRLLLLSDLLLRPRSPPLASGERSRLRLLRLDAV